MEPAPDMEPVPDMEPAPTIGTEPEHGSDILWSQVFSILVPRDERHDSTDVPTLST